MSVLVRCRACHEDINARFRVCPHCGARVPRSWERPAKIAALALGVLAPGYYIYSVHDDDDAPVVVASGGEQEVQHQEDLHRVCRVREANRAAANFQIVKVVRLPEGDLCVHFSRANAVGSSVGERWLVPSPDKGQPKRTKTCDGLPGPDRTAFVARDLSRCPG